MASESAVAGFHRFLPEHSNLLRPAVPGPPWSRHAEPNPLLGTVTLLGLTLAAASLDTLEAQQPAPVPISRISVDPGSLTLEVGQTVPVKLTAWDSAGHEIASPAVRVSAPRGALRLSQNSVTGWPPASSRSW